MWSFDFSANTLLIDLDKNINSILQKLMRWSECRRCAFCIELHISFPCVLSAEIDFLR